VRAVIGVVVPVRNGGDVLAGQLRALERQQYAEPWRVYVSDNGSTDDTVAVAQSFAASLRLTVVVAGTKPGVNRARNAGSRAAIADGASVLVFCDADDAVDAGWLVAMAHASTRWDVWGGSLDRVRLTNPRRLLDTEIRSAGLNVWNGYLPFAPGANFGVHSHVWEVLGGFDERFVDGGDDVDFSWRAQQAGFSIGFEGKAVVHYRERTGVAAIWRQARGHGRQYPALYQKHRLHGMPRSLLRDAARGWAHIVVKAPRYVGTPARRREWIRLAARRWGRLEGSIRSRTVYL
jgi:GT2 family glycosyltransferase